MNEPFLFPHHRHRWKAARRNKSGVVLVMVLVVIVLATLLATAYLISTQEERGAASHYTYSLRTTVLLQSSLQLIEADLKNEMQQGSSVSTSSGQTIFLPGPNNTPNAFLSQPARIVTTQEATAFPNLLRRSSRSQFLTINTPSGANYPYTHNPFTLLASALSTSDASANGRYITTARWNKPVMMDPGALSNFTPPDWVLMTREGPLAFTSSTSATSPDGTTVTADPGNASPLNTTYVTGRFAYVIYRCDNGIDVNAAGSPSQGFSSNTASAAAKRHRIQPFADLSQLPGFSTTLNNALVTFRNQTTAATPSSLYNATKPSDPTTFYGWATNPLYGFLYPASGDQLFLTRQELLYFLQNQGIDLSSSKLPTYLSVFTRESNSPSYVPSPTRPKVSATLDDAANPAFPTMTCPIAFTIPQDATLKAPLQINVGDPLVIRRFALSRLAWLTHNGPSADLATTDPLYNTSGTDANISRYFGLSWDSTNKRWIYNHGNPDAIYTLGDLVQNMSTQQREPDFFELLKASLTYGSLGLDLDTGTTQPAVTAASTNVDLQIFQIGANIIDQADTDGYPTVLTYSNGGGFPEVYGIEDLPYLNKLYPLFLRAPGTNQLNGYMLPEFWRPHYVSGTGPLANGPTQFRICIEPGSTCMVLANWSADPGPAFPNGVPVPIQYAFQTVTGSTKTFTASDEENSALNFSVPMSDGSDLDTPKILLSTNSTTANSANRVTNTIYSNIFGTGGSSSSWNLMFLNSVPLPAGTTKIQWPAFYNSTLSFELQYLDGTTWRTYSEWKTITGTHGSYDQADGISPDTYYFDTHFHYHKLDPRSDRMGADMLYNGYVWGGNMGIENRVADDPAYEFLGGVNCYGAYIFRPSSVQWLDPTNLQDWQRWTDLIRNTQAAGQNYYSDPDSVVRGGDGFYAVGDTSGNLISSTIGNPMAIGNAISRPVMLNRPFQSVAELGYVYRDEPWRSLDFFTAQSPDAALLDVFSVDEAPPVRAGMVNLNTPFPEVLEALLSAQQGTTSIPLHELGSGGDPSSTDTLSATEIRGLAQAITTKSLANPFMNRSELATKVAADASIVGNYANDNSRQIKTRRETVVRALSEATQDRTWNFLIDVVVQTGRYPSSRPVNSLSGDFIVEGEKRVWWHVAIDRYTGKIIDQQIEPVYE